MRVYEAAKKFKLSAEDIVTVLKKAKLPVKSHMSGMTGEMIAVVEKHAKGAKPAAKTKSKAKARTVAKAKTVTREKTTVKTKTKVKTGTKAAVKTKMTAKAKSTAKAKTTDRKVTSKVEAARSAVAKVKAKASVSVEAAKAKVKPFSPAPAPAKKQPVRRKELSVAEAAQKAVQDSVRRTLAKIETTRHTKRRKGKTRGDALDVERPITVAEDATVRELADALKVTPNEVAAQLTELGAPTPVNEKLDRETIELVAEEIGKAVQFVSQEIEGLLEPVAKVDESRFIARAPIVTVMGHVDHGKTSILDYIRKSNVASGEAGGITQHVGAYQVNLPKGQITFIDTPGHEAFTSMRARGAQVTDIVVLVIASDDGIMPQTVEAINHAKAAKVPIIVALNKSDLPAARPDQIKQQLTKRGVVVEEFGGDSVSVEVSAKTGDGIDRLLEMILLQAELLELKADPQASAQAVAVEVKKEEGRGILCTVLVTQGTLGIGDVFVIGEHYGKVRALLDDRGGSIKEVGPGYPVQLLGANGMPNAGDKLMVVKGEREARDVSERRQLFQKERDRSSEKKMTLEELFSQIQQGEVKELRLVVKADTNGSVEALTQSLTKLTNDEVGVKVIHAGVGVASESDVLLAATSDAVVIAFSVKTSPKAQELAEREKVEIKSYDIIYEVLEEVDAAMKGLLDPILSEKVLGRAEIRKVFKVPRLGFIAGSFVTEGLIQRNASARVLRKDEVIHEGKISSLKRFQDDVREVQTDFECGIGITGFSDPREGDIIEAFVIEETARVS